MGRSRQVSEKVGRVYILGAGASKFAGYPLANQLWNFMKRISSGEYWDRRRREGVVPLIERFRLESGERNLENLFTYLDLTSLIPSGPVQCGYIRWAEDRPKLIGAMSDAFQSWEYELEWKIIGRERQVTSPSGDPVDGIRVGEVLNAWTQRIHAGDIIISFNWDMLHEAALWRAKKWNYTDGYGFRPAKVNGGVPSPVQVLKLHGSANWVQEFETDKDASIEEIGTFFQGAQDEEDTPLLEPAQWDGGRKSLVIPTYLKNITGNRLLLDIWSQAARYLRIAEEIVVIGYSLNKADLPARYLIATSIRENPRCDRVELVMHDSGEWSDFCFSVGIGMRRVKETFEEWVLGSAA